MLLGKVSTSSLLIIIASLAHCSLATLLLSSVSVANQTIKAVTDYSFQIDRFGQTGLIPAGTEIEILFPSQYSGINIDSCQPLFWSGATSLTCSFSALKLTVAGGFTSDSAITQIMFMAHNVENPFPAKQYLFSMRFKYPNVTYKTAENQGQLTIAPGLAICSLSLQGNVFEQGQVTISYQSTFISYNDLNYLLLLNMNNYYSSDPLQNDITADIINVDRTYLDSYLFRLMVVDQIVLKMLMPPSTAPQVDFIYILAQNLQGDRVDYCYLTISGVNPNTFVSLSLSPQQVQLKTNINVLFLSNSPLMPSDKIKIDFDGTQFNISQLQANALFYKGISGERLIKKSGNLLEISNFVAVASSNVQYGFALRDIIMPPSNRPQNVLITLETGSDYLRDKQTLVYSSSPGQLTSVSLNCILTEIGYTTTCYLSFTFTSIIPSDGYVKISFPAGFSIGNTSSQCDTSGVNINVKSTCTGYEVSNSIHVSQLINSGLTISAGTSLNITLKDLKIPVDPKTYSIGLSAHMSDASLIDQATVTLTSIKRALTYLSVSPSSLYTDTSATYYATFQLDLNLGYPYILSMYFPFTNISTVTVNNNLLSSNFDSTTKILTINSISSNQISITGFKTHISTAPVTLSGNITYNGLIYYYFTAYDVAISSPKSITSFSFQQSNKIVNEGFIGTFVVNGLAVNDIIQLDPQYYDFNQSDCSSNCVCQDQGKIVVLGVNNKGTALTQIKVNLLNPPYITSIPTTFLVKDSTGNYQKQIKSYNIEASQTNSLTISETQSHPFYGEQSTYTFNVTMSTQFPSTSLSNTLKVIFPQFAFTIKNYTCILGCSAQAPQLISGTIYFFVSSTIVRLMIGVVNPADPAIFSSTSITMTSASLGQMDSGEYQPIHPCTDRCRECSPSNSSFCLNCYNSTIWQYDRFDQNVCVSQCPTGKYLQSSNQSCQSCSIKCLTCSESATHCSSPCNTGYYYLNFQCLDVCPTGYYQSVNYLCKICESNCVKCTLDTVCTECSSTTYLYKQSCQISCLAGTYINPLFNECIDCSENCKNCDSTGCIQCDAGFFLALGSCLTQCPDNLYENGQVCESCQSPCKTCAIMSDNCTSCVVQLNSVKYYYLQENYQCLENACPDTYYISPSSNVCLKCNSPCQTCTASKCLTCQVGYNFYEGSCFINCPSATYKGQNNICIQCVSPCLACLSELQCLSCVSQRFFYHDQCLAACPPGYFKNTQTNTCDQCNLPCLTCSGSAAFCLSCSHDIFYNNTCITSCPSNYFETQEVSIAFPDITVKLCKQCTNPCLNCITLSTRCKSCISGYGLFQEQCLQKCPDFYFNKNGVCQPCEDPCFECNETGCISCKDQTHYFENQNCVSECIYLHENNKTMQCQKCQSPCSTCTWSDTCLTCQTGYVYFNSECLISCPAGMYQNGQNCFDCPEFCEDCSLKNDQIRCTRCLNNTLLYGYLCVQDCPSLYFIDSIYCVTEECTTLANCLTCSSLRCLSCETNYTLDITSNVCNYDPPPTDPQKTITSVSELPVPFPFLIAIIAIIVLAFLIRIQFHKMFVVIFIYAFSGIVEAGSLGLWIALILTRGVFDTQDSMFATEGEAFYLKIAALALCGMYVLFNLVGCILYCTVTRFDRKYALWQKQDNRCSAAFVTLFSFLISFRFALIKFSKLAHKQAFSAPLSSDSKLSHLTILAYLSIVLVSLPAVGLAGYIGYQQVTQNYLFFTCIEVAVVGVIMIILSILQALIPKKYAVEKKEEYKQGFDNDGIDGQSLDQVLAVDIGQEEYYYGKEIVSDPGDQVKADNTAFAQDQQEMQRGSESSDLFGKIARQNLQQKIPRQLPSVDQRQELDDILVQAQNLAARLNNQPSRPFGTIKKQVINDLSSGSSDSESIGSLESNQKQQSELSNNSEQDDEPPPINQPFSKHKKNKSKKLQPNIIEQKHKAMDVEQLNLEIEAGLQYNYKKGRSSKLQQLFKQIEEQEKQERGLRERLKKLNQKEKELKEKQYQRARELMERNQMAIEDQLGKVNRILTKRNAQEKERKQKMKELQEQRKKDRQEREMERKKSTKPIQKFKSQPQQSHFLVEEGVQEIDEGIKKIRVRSKQTFDDNLYIDKEIQEIDDEPEQIQTNGAQNEEQWLNQQNQVNFLPEENWQMAPENPIPEVQEPPQEPEKQVKHQKQSPRIKRQIIPEETDPDGNTQQNVEIIHWPIDPQLQEKINEVDERATYYIKRKKQKPAIEQSLEIQPLSSEPNPSYEIVYNEHQALQDDDDIDSQLNGVSQPILPLGQKIKIPKGRVNKNVIDLSPNK